jgi:hypothetical protein
MGLLALIGGDNRWHDDESSERHLSCEFDGELGTEPGEAIHGIDCSHGSASEEVGPVVNSVSVNLDVLNVAKGTGFSVREEANFSDTETIGWLTRGVSTYAIGRNGDGVGPVRALVEAFERRNVTVLIIFAVVSDGDRAVASIEGSVGWIELDTDSLQRNSLIEVEDNGRLLVVIAAGFVGSRDILVTHPVGVHVLKLTSWRVDLVRAPNKVDAVLRHLNIRRVNWVVDVADVGRA